MVEIHSSHLQPHCWKGVFFFGCILFYFIFLCNILTRFDTGGAIRISDVIQMDNVSATSGADCSKSSLVSFQLVSFPSLLPLMTFLAPLAQATPHPTLRLYFPLEKECDILHKRGLLVAELFIKKRLVINTRSALMLYESFVCLQTYRRKQSPSDIMCTKILGHSAMIFAFFFGLFCFD